MQADEIDRRYQVLQQRKQKLDEELELELTDSNIDDLLHFRKVVADGLNHPTPEERRLWLELLQTRVTVSNRIATVICRLSGKAVRSDPFTGYQISTTLNRSQSFITIEFPPIALAGIFFV